MTIGNMSRKHNFDVSMIPEELEILEAHDYKILHFSEYHFRINDKLDVWPTARKYFLRGSNTAVPYHPRPLSEVVFELLPHKCPI